MQDELEIAAGLAESLSLARQGMAEAEETLRSAQKELGVAMASCEEAQEAWASWEKDFLTAHAVAAVV